MKTYLSFVIAMTAVAVSPTLHAQDANSIGWDANYTLTTSASTACINGPLSGTCTISQAVTADPHFEKSGGLSWGSNADKVSSVSFNDRFVGSCNPPPGTLTQKIVGTTGTSSADLSVDAAGGTYTFFPQPFANIIETVSGCGSSISGPGNPAMFPISNWPQTFALPPTVQPLKMNNFGFTANSLVPVPNLPIPWKFSFTLIPTYQDDDPCTKNGGAGDPVSSSVSCQNQSLAEDVPIVGTGFYLHYEGNRAPGAGANAAASTYASMLGGWTLSVHHAIDPVANTLFLGDGTQRNGYQLGRGIFFNGNFLFTSKGGSEVYVFSAFTGQHLKTLRPLTGAVLYQFGYDSAGKLVSVTDATGNVTNIHRNSSEHPTAIVSPYGQITTLKTDSNGFLTQVTDPLGKSATFVNTGTGLLTSRTDRNGNIFTYSYDSHGRLIKDADPLGGFITLTHASATSGFGWTATQNTSVGRTSSYQTTLSMPWTQTSTSVFSKHHTITWPSGLQATQTTTQKGSQISESFNLPDGTSFSDTLGPDPVWGIQVPVATSETLTQGNLTMNISGNRTASLSTATNPFTLVSRTDRAIINGRTYTSVFTASNRTFVRTTPVGRKRTAVLDTKERLASVQIGTLLASNFAYDSRGRLSTATQGTRTTTFTYDSDGRLAMTTDPLGLKNSFSYDADGRLLSATLPDGRLVGYQHDANGNLTAIIPPGKAAHNFDYTAVNQLSEYLPSIAIGTGPTTYTYNADRDIMKITRPDLKTISFQYDAAGRISSILTPSETVNYTYSSATGNRTGASVTSGEALAYSYVGPLPTITNWVGTVNGNVSRAYNNNFWLTSQTVGGGNTIALSYDNDGFLTNAGALTLNRSPQDGRITGATLGLATDSRSYSVFGELADYTASYNGAALYGVSYTRDADGRVSNETETIGGHTNGYAYSYDLAGRLIGVSKNGTHISTYIYDSNSNRTKATTTTGSVTATYDAQDRLLTYGAGAYTYTANGELASKAVGVQSTTYQYDVLGNLVSVALPGSRTITYVVDAQNRRVGKKVNGVLVEGFLYDDDTVVAQLNGSNVVVSQFIYATDRNSPDYMISGGVTYRIFSDQLGSPRLVVNTSTGAIAEQIAYDEFGNVIGDTSPGFQPFGFAGGLYDQDTKLVRFGARDYDPNVGRWTSKDPIRFTGGDTNLYGYVLDDPVNSTDFSGLDDPAPGWYKKAVHGEQQVRKWIKDLIKKKLCKKCEEGNEPPEPEGNGVSGGEQSTEVGTHVAVEVAGEVGEAVGSEAALETAGKVVGPAATAVNGSEALAQGMINMKHYFDRLHELIDQCSK